LLFARTYSAGGFAQYVGKPDVYVRDIVILTAYAAIAQNRCIPSAAPYSVAYRVMDLDPSTQARFTRVGEPLTFTNTFSAAALRPEMRFGNTVFVAIANSEEFIPVDAISSVPEHEILGKPGTKWTVLASREVSVSGRNRRMAIIKPAENHTVESIRALWMAP
jgi:hypothetical protein